MHTDPIADMLTRVRNASKAGHEEVRVPGSRMSKNILEVMKTGRFVKSVKEVKDGKFPEIKVGLDVERKLGLKRISKPGRRVFVKSDEIKPVLDGFGMMIVSTSKGLMNGTEAKKQKLGGEIICEIS